MNHKKAADDTLAIVEIPVEQLFPNDWNPNRMTEKMRSKLKSFIRKQGFVEPIIVRSHGDGYQILAGFHRFGIAKELGYDTLPCVVVNLDDRRARILSINLNEMKGQSVPSLLSDLLADLNHVMPMSEMEAVLPYEKAEIQDFLSLMQLPEGLADELEEEAREHDANAPMAITLVLDRKQAELWDKTVEAAKEEVGCAINPKARTLALLCEMYLGSIGDENARAECKAVQGAKSR